MNKELKQKVEDAIIVILKRTYNLDTDRSIILDIQLEFEDSATWSWRCWQTAGRWCEYLGIANWDGKNLHMTKLHTV